MVHPDKPARIGDSVVVQFKHEGAGDLQAIIALLHKTCADGVELKKLNPGNIIKIEQNKINSIHRILTMNEVFGV